MTTVHALYLNETDWYAQSEDEHERLKDQCLAEAKARNAQYACIIVRPEAVLSISPNPKPHQVWNHTLENTDERRFKMGLSELLQRSTLSHARKRAILKLFAESYGK